MGIHILIVTNPRSGRDFSNRKSCLFSLTVAGTNIQIVYWIPLWRIFTKNGRCHCFGRMTKQNKFKTSQNNNDNSTDNSTSTTTDDRRPHRRCHIYFSCRSQVSWVKLSMQECSVYFYRLKYSPLMIYCATVCGSRVGLRGREDVDANVCGVADEAGGVRWVWGYSFVFSSL